MDAFFQRNRNARSCVEWLGLICAFTWFFSTMLSYYEPFFSGTAIVLVFMLLLCAGLAASAMFFKKQPMFMNRTIIVCTASGAVSTALIPFLPIPAAVVLFWLTALFMTPLLCRRLYGVLMTAHPEKRMRTYISAVSVTIVIQMIWALLPLSHTVKFPVLLLFALFGLYGISARLPEFRKQELPKSAGSPVTFMKVIIVMLLLVVLNLFNTLIHTHVLVDSLENNDLFSLITWAIVPFSFYAYGWFSDKGKERMGFGMAVAMLLLGCLIALMPEGSVLAAPILLLGEFGGTITEYCFLTMPLLFFPYTKRPFLVAVSGLIMHTLLASAIPWTQDLWLPPALLEEQISRPLVIFGAVCVLILIPLVFSIWRSQKDAALMAALIGLQKLANRNQATPAAPSEPPQAAADELALPLDLLEDEHHVVQLLCDGLTRTEIADKLGMQTSQVSLHLNHIQQKLDSRLPLGLSPGVVKLSGQYGLTARETEVLNELLLGRSNAEIGANLHIEETTVKTHVGKVLKKVGAGNRTELIAKLRG